jgi:hypothetical protein
MKISKLFLVGIFLGKSLNAVDVFQIFTVTSVIGTLFLTSVDSFMPRPVPVRMSFNSYIREIDTANILIEKGDHQKAYTVLKNILNSKNSGTYSCFLDRINAIKELVKLKIPTDIIEQYLNATLQFSDIRTENKITVSDILMDIQSITKAKNILKPIIQSPIYTDLGWPEQLTFTSNKFEAISRLIKFPSEYYFIENALDQMVTNPNLGSTDKLKIAIFYLDVKAPGKAIPILKDLCDSPTDFIKEKSREILKSQSSFP